MSETTERFKIKTASYIILQKNGKTLFLRRANSGWGDGKLTPPAGHIDPGETARQAAAREAYEETGIKVELADLELKHIIWVKDNYVDFYFVAQTWQGEPRIMETNKCSELKWATIEEVKNELISKRCQIALEDIEKGIIYSESDYP